MNQATIKSLVKSQEWQELKDYFNSEIVDRPLTIKTEGMDANRIALEILSSQLAVKKIVNALKKLERIGNKEVAKAESWK